MTAPARDGAGAARAMRAALADAGLDAARRSTSSARTAPARCYNDAMEMAAIRRRVRRRDRAHPRQLRSRAPSAIRSPPPAPSRRCSARACCATASCRRPRAASSSIRPARSTSCAARRGAAGARRAVHVVGVCRQQRGDRAASCSEDDLDAQRRRGAERVYRCDDATPFAPARVSAVRDADCEMAERRHHRASASSRRSAIRRPSWRAAWRAGERAPPMRNGGVRIAEIPLDAVPAGARTRIGRLDRLCRLLRRRHRFSPSTTPASRSPPCAAERVGLVVRHRARLSAERCRVLRARSSPTAPRPRARASSPTPCRAPPPAR